MKYLFLDFDGVICTAKSYKQGDKQWQRDGRPAALGHKQGDNYGFASDCRGDSAYNCGPYRIDAELAKDVQKICDTQDQIVIVLSTTWRRLYELKHLRIWLNEKGITAPIVGRTDLFYLKELDEYERGHLIQRWCQDNGVPIEDIVILDDNEILDPNDERGRYLPIASQFVHIKKGWSSGITQRHINQAIGILEGNLSQVNKQLT
jgi:hypothetical protein